MGMIARFYEVTEATLSEFLRRPSLAYDYTMSSFFKDSTAVEKAKEMIEELRTKMAGLPPGAIGQLEHVAALFNRKVNAQKGPQLVTSKPEEETECKEFSLEKDWHVLHYALNGTHDGGTRPLADAILGGREIPDVERASSFGMRYLTAEEVGDVANALKNVDPRQLLSKLDFEEAEQKEIYLSHTLQDLSDWEYLPDLFMVFRDFYIETARKRNAMLLSIT